MGTLEHIRSRIEWKARKHGLPKGNTGFWADCPIALQSAATQIKDPVIYSMTPQGCATIIGSDAILLIGPDNTVAIPLSALADVASEEFRKGKQKTEFAELAITDLDGTRYRAYTEKGASCFAVWNVILMLVRMNKKLTRSLHSTPR